LVQLLSESYNPHVRCGATLALGIACAGTGLQVSICQRAIFFALTWDV
jgi:26S proteasome regulatory subunit N2